MALMQALQEQYEGTAQGSRSYLDPVPPPIA